MTTLRRTTGARRTTTTAAAAVPVATVATAAATAGLGGLRVVRRLGVGSVARPRVGGALCMRRRAAWLLGWVALATVVVLVGRPCTASGTTATAPCAAAFATWRVLAIMLLLMLLMLLVLLMLLLMLRVGLGLGLSLGMSLRLCRGVLRCSPCVASRQRQRRRRRRCKATAVAV